MIRTIATEQILALMSKYPDPRDELDPKRRSKFIESYLADQRARKTGDPTLLPPGSRSEIHFFRPHSSASVGQTGVTLAMVSFAISSYRPIYSDPDLGLLVGNSLERLRGSDRHDFEQWPKDIVLLVTEDMFPDQDLLAEVAQERLVLVKEARHTPETQPPPHVPATRHYIEPAGGTATTTPTKGSFPLWAYLNIYTVPLLTPNWPEIYVRRPTTIRAEAAWRAAHFYEPRFEPYQCKAWTATLASWLESRRTHLDLDLGS